MDFLRTIDTSATLVAAANAGGRAAQTRVVGHGDDGVLPGVDDYEGIGGDPDLGQKFFKEAIDNKGVRCHEYRVPAPLTHAPDTAIEPAL